MPELELHALFGRGLVRSDTLVTNHLQDGNLQFPSFVVALVKAQNTGSLTRTTESFEIPEVDPLSGPHD